jgi:hypothetical protein
MMSFGMMLPNTTRFARRISLLIAGWLWGVVVHPLSLPSMALRRLLGDLGESFNWIL